MTKTSLFGPHEMMKVDTDGDFWQEKANKNLCTFSKDLIILLRIEIFKVLALKSTKNYCNKKKYQIRKIIKTSLLGPHESR